MKRTSLIFALSLLFTPLVGAQGETPETIFWYTGNFPPVHFTDGPYKNRGSGDVRREILIKLMPEFRHEIVTAAPGRTYETLRTQPNACNASMLKTPERAATLEYSEPFLEILPNGVITTRARLDLFKPFMNKQGELKLGEFVGAGKHRLGIIEGRSFGPGIDAILKNPSNKNSLLAVPSSDHFQSRLLKLIHQDEYEAIVGYATEMAYVSRELDVEQKVVFLPVAEEPRLVPSYVVCSKSDFGKRVIAAINRALSNPETQREVDVAYRHWLDQDSSTRFEQLRKQTRGRK